MLKNLSSLINLAQLCINNIVLAGNLATNYQTFLIGALSCLDLSPPDNGRISVTPGPNSLKHGLGSVATYSCDSGYVLAGHNNRTCEDTNGGIVTTGIWSGTSPYCQGINYMQ